MAGYGYFLMLLCLAGGAAIAAETDDGSACVSVEVDGVRTLPYGCLSRQLAAPALGAKAPGETALEPLSARTAQRPGNELGLYNRSATSIRMGSNFGRSATPQRPVAPPVRSPLLPAR